MLLDTELISYLNKIISKDTKITEDRIKAAKEAFEEKDYENICNLKLLYYSNATYDSVILESNFANIALLIFIFFFLVNAIVYCGIGCCKCCCCCCEQKCQKCQKCDICCCDCCCHCISCCYCCDICSFTICEKHNVENTGDIGV